ncbi:MAG: RpiB/LacA/LacB family sugar-phosphate isomerase [Planctomycetota bacterium]
MSRPLITVNTLVAQLRERGAVELPQDALITPAAADWLRGTHVPVRRLAANPDEDGSGSANGRAGAAAHPAQRPAAPDLYVVGDGRIPVLKTLLPGLEREYAGVKFLSCRGVVEGLCSALHEACTGLAGCTQRRALVVVVDGAIASCVANKYPHVRAAIVTRPSVVYDLVHRLAANLLILESERLSLRQMQGIVAEFLRGKPELEPAVAEALEQATARSPAVSVAGANGEPVTAGNARAGAATTSGRVCCGACPVK